MLALYKSYCCSAEAWCRWCSFARRTSLPCEFTRHSSCSGANFSTETSLQIVPSEMPRTNSSSLIYWKIRSNISPYSMNPLLFDVFFRWEARKRNLFTRLLVPLVLLRTERHTAICRHLSAFPRWKSLVHSRISRLVTKKTIFCRYPPKIATISTIFYEKF